MIHCWRVGPLAGMGSLNKHYIYCVIALDEIREVTFCRVNLHIFW